ncbi:17 kDa surface antigen [Magnetococcus marinus MC-1]|uniref:17 kDa surface antigen n=1 Tax=Magnetococcus marinus (strain ATCC BAA-1437 / JCM 17883 / MC-1) TaxID=156889 RepID=A0L4I4_MAGMM|nr:YMGG-like glycine zipper-containing protein [Magnetococcus marinus]ABK42877.1 17 kDa surface antigen [Magnetococcus marinus MC-1]
MKSGSGTFKWMVISVAALFLLSGCAAPQNKAQGGAMVGALGGGLAGSLMGNSKHKERNALIGAALGGLLGYSIGNEMDKADLLKLNNAYESTPSYQTTDWVNPDSGRKYEVTPKPAARTAGRVCRDAEIKVWIDGRPETAIQRACRNPDGTWQMI